MLQSPPSSYESTDEDSYSDCDLSKQQSQVRPRKAVLKSRFARGKSKKADKEQTEFGLQRRGIKRQGESSAKNKVTVRAHQVP
jgi:hypothetical protein